VPRSLVPLLLQSFMDDQIPKRHDGRNYENNQTHIH
jgi:hypothetical protein